MKLSLGPPQTQLFCQQKVDTDLPRQEGKSELQVTVVERCQVFLGGVILGETGKPKLKSPYYLEARQPLDRPDPNLFHKLPRVTGVVSMVCAGVPAWPGALGAAGEHHLWGTWEFAFRWL
jgi:hypothetical protein